MKEEVKVEVAVDLVAVKRPVTTQEQLILLEAGQLARFFFATLAIFKDCQSIPYLCISMKRTTALLFSLRFL